MPDEDLRKDYEDRKPRYRRLIELVKLIILSALESEELKVHSVKSRVKDFYSFTEKIERKRYERPFEQCTDLAGVRILCLFLSQVEQVKKIIAEEFEVLEATDKRSTKKYDQFGYLSLHMLVKIPKHRLKYVEYAELKDLVCEIQVRTILQEAWAEIEHYLNYKATKEVKNEKLLRKIFSLAGMFEVADSTFEEIHTGFSQMVEKEIKDDSISALHLYQFSKRLGNKMKWNKQQERQYFRLSDEIKKLGITSLRQIEDLVKKYREELTYLQTKKTSADLIRAALALEYGQKFDLAYGIKGYSDQVQKDLVVRKYKKY